MVIPALVKAHTCSRDEKADVRKDSLFKHILVQ